MFRYGLLIIVIVLVYCASMTASYAENKLEEKIKVDEPKKQLLVRDIEEIVRNIKEVSKKYCMTWDQAINNVNYISEAKHGASVFLKILDRGTNEKTELIYHDPRRSNAEAVLEDRNGNKKLISYYLNCSVGSYQEGHNKKLHGVYAEFFEDGTLESFGEFKDNKYCGREMHWNKSGQLIESKINDCTEEFGIIEKSDTGKHKIIIDDDDTQRIIPIK